MGWCFIFFRNNAPRSIALHFKQFINRNDFHIDNSNILIGGGKDRGKSERLMEVLTA